MCASNSPPVISCQIGVATKYQFQQPDECPAAVCSALAMYEQELDRHRDTEAQLRQSVRCEINLLRQKKELILQKDILSKESEHRLLNGLQLIISLLSLQSRPTKNAEAAAQLTIAAQPRRNAGAHPSASPHFRQHGKRRIQAIS